MSNKKIAPYGSWKSPISADLIVADSIRFGQAALHDSSIYWVERRPSEKGRGVLVRRDSDGNRQDLTPEPYNVRTRVHEYGGGDFLVTDQGVFFSNYADGGVYRRGPGGGIDPVLQRDGYYFADFAFDEKYGQLIAVQEDRSGEGEAVNRLVALDLESGEITVLLEGNDFYSNPRISPDGTRLVWLTWNHPNMPWDGTELKLGWLEKGRVEESSTVAGGEDESIFQPEWSPEGEIFFISDRTGWWNLYRIHKGEHQAVVQVDAEMGQPQWIFNMSTYGFVDENELLCYYSKDGRARLLRVSYHGGGQEEIAVPFTDLDELRVSETRAVGKVGYQDRPGELVALDLESERFETLRRANEIDLDEAYVSRAEKITFPTSDGHRAHAYFYPPRNVDYRGPEGELPPLFVKCHGGPTSSTSARLNLKTQFWTSRGFAVVDVDYRGSTGYGRAYRDFLQGNWGIYDVEDCLNAVRFLIDRGSVDDEKLVISGGSAGGYTVLCALTFHDIFDAGASYYGIGDLETLTGEIHKFESRYLDSLVGPYPEQKTVYEERSPINFVEKLSSPVIFFQGMEDLVVPPRQSEMMVEALDEKGVSVAYITYEEEQHGFRQAENIKRSLEAELYFYGKILGFEPADEIKSVEIRNLEGGE